MEKTIAEYKLGSISFFIPFRTAEPEHQINEAIQDINSLAEEIENGYDEAERFDAYMRNGEESLLRELEYNFPL